MSRIKNIGQNIASILGDTVYPSNYATNIDLKIEQIVQPFIIVNPINHQFDRSRNQGRGSGTQVFNYIVYIITPYTFEGKQEQVQAHNAKRENVFDTLAFWNNGEYGTISTIQSDQLYDFETLKGQNVIKSSLIITISQQLVVC